MTGGIKSVVAATLFGLLVGCAGPVPTAPTVPGQLTSVPSPASGPILEPVASGFTALTFATSAGDGSGDLYVVAQVGRIFKLSASQSTPGTPWLDISSRISSGGERGLLGLAFHPDFKDNGRFFVNYSDVNGNTVISEFQRGADGTVDPGAERVVLQVGEPFPNHNGGMLSFGPDGFLYIGLGDGGGEGDTQGSGQSVGTLLGKILRIDVDSESGDPYSVPATNPFRPGFTQPAMSEIWDWGLRNPWRFSFDRQSGALFIGDVGQDQTEEIDVEPAGLGGRNYGWNIMEGDHCYNATTCDQTGLTLPVATYSHQFGCAVTGGYVYRGTRFPDLVGSYFYSDYCSGTIWTFPADAAVAGAPISPSEFGVAPFNVSSFGQDDEGEIYVVDGAGAVYALVDPG